MQTTLNVAIESYLRMHPRSRGTRNEYHSTLRKWEQWGRGGSRAYLPASDLPRELAAGANRADEQLITLQRQAAQPRPYRFILNKVEEKKK